VTPPTDRERKSSLLTRRQALVGVSALAGAPVLPMFDALAAPRAYTLTPQKLTDGVWMVQGAAEVVTTGNGGAIANIGILDSSEGAIIVDTGPSRRYGEQLVALARELTGKDVARVYLTHFHPDHVFGNQAFKPDAIAASEGVIKGLREVGEGFASAMYASAGDWMRGTELVLPTNVITQSYEDVGTRRMRLLRMRGHTGADLVVYDELTGVMFAGDLVFLDRAPTTPHANFEHWRVALANLGGIPHGLLVPGHGPAQQGSRGVDQTRTWLSMLDEVIGGAFEQGLDMTEAIALPLPAWTQPIALARYEYERSVMHMYPKLEAKRLPRVDLAK
jgi:quinoprotein relay system zinc metallohydrolase 1